jgi:N-acetylglucosamine kinase-like BadF-type ATPase
MDSEMENIFMSKANRTESAAVLAVDAGGTHCRAGIYTSDGKLVAYSVGGPSNYQSCGSDSVIRTLTNLFFQLIENISVKAKNTNTTNGLTIEAAVFALAGLDTGADRKILDMVVHEAMQNAHITASQVILENDALMTLKGYLRKKPGILLISGTGAIVYGQDKNDNHFRAGGWGHRAGDEGSGFAIGSEAIRHIFRVKDGRDEPSTICTSVLHELSLSSTDALLSFVYSDQYSPYVVAGLAKTICALALDGDTAAKKIVSQAASDLSEIAASVIHKLEPSTGTSKFYVMLSGGVIQGSNLFRSEVLSILQNQFPDLILIPRKYEPIYSALRYGLYQLGYEEMMS